MPALTTFLVSTDPKSAKISDIFDGICMRKDIEPFALYDIVSVTWKWQGNAQAAYDTGLTCRRPPLWPDDMLLIVTTLGQARTFCLSRPNGITRIIQQQMYRNLLKMGCSFLFQNCITSTKDGGYVDISQAP